MNIKTNKFGERLCFLRETAGMTQNSLALKLAVTRQSISLYETGIRECSLDMVIKIAALFNVTTDYLLGVSDDFHNQK